MLSNEENRVRCSHCGCLFDRRRGICPFCATPLMESRQVTRQSIQTERIQPSYFERKIIKAMRKADTQRSLIIVLLAGILVMNLLSVIVMLLR